MKAEVVDRPSANSVVHYVKYKTPPGLSNRGILTTIVFREGARGRGARRPTPAMPRSSDTERGTAFAVFLVMGMLQILSKGSAVALLAITNTTWLLLYFIVDVVVLLSSAVHTTASTQQCRPK